jgi:hypothetical protein|nr:MAG TPA: hypothetical protein [Caudoviricetes sp.]
MSELIRVLEKQLEIESTAAKNKLTAANLDSIAKLTTAICNLKCMENESWGREIVAEATETAISKYSNGKYDHNIDALYDAYIAAKKSYQEIGDQGHRDKLMESVGRLMVEVYDMLSAMVIDSDFQDEKAEIMKRIRMLADG